MKVYDIYDEACRLMGYNEQQSISADNQAIKERTVAAVNMIGYDLFKLKPLKHLFDEVQIPERYYGALIYGVCMLISLSCGDDERNRYFTENYNLKRCCAKSERSSVSDNMPSVGGV